MLRLLAQSTAVPTGSGNVRMTYFTAKTTQPVDNLTVPVGTTAASGATTIVFGQYSIDVSGNLTLLAATTNDAMLLAGGSGAESTKALSATINEIAGVRYARALFFVGATAPTVYGAVLPSPETARTPRLAGLLSGQSGTTLPSTISVGSVSASGA